MTERAVNCSNAVKAMTELLHQAIIRAIVGSFSFPPLHSDFTKQFVPR